MVWAILGFLASLGWGVAAGIRLESKLSPWMVRNSRGSAWRAALLAVGVQVSGLLVFGLLCLVGIGLAQATGSHRLAAIGVLPACLAYMPVLCVAIPSRFRGFKDVREELEAAGATRGMARAAAWAGGPIAVLGVSLVCAALLGTFAT